MKNHRQFTVGSLNKNDKKVPFIRLSGQWLVRNGIQIGRSFRVRVRPDGIDLVFEPSPAALPEVIEGFLVMHHQGYYAIYNQGLIYELRRNDCVAVEFMKDAWVPMTVMKDAEGYYLQNQEIAFYPKMVYGRLLPPK